MKRGKKHSLLAPLVATSRPSVSADATPSDFGREDIASAERGMTSVRQFRLLDARCRPHGLAAGSGRLRALGKGRRQPITFQHAIDGGGLSAAACGSNFHFETGDKRQHGNGAGKTDEIRSALHRTAPPVFGSTRSNLRN